MIIKIIKNLKNNENKYKSFIIWDGLLNDEKKQLIKTIINSKENLIGLITD